MKTFPKLTNYRNASFIAFLKDVVTISNKFDPTALKITTEIAAINALLVQLDSTYATARANGNTETLESLDARRDAALIGITMVAEAYQKHYDPAISEAGRSISIIIAKYGKRLPWQSYLVETEAIRSMVNTFETEAKAMAAISKLKISDWVLELKNANTEFSALFLVRNQELSEQPDENMRDLRLPATESYKTLIKLVTAYDTLNPNGDYAKILEQVDQLIAKYNALVPVKPTDEPPTPPQA
ncbi:MAG: DUF6261 family protein [Bacteroidota bacterium]